MSHVIKASPPLHTPLPSPTFSFLAVIKSLCSGLSRREKQSSKAKEKGKRVRQNALNASLTHRSPETSIPPPFSATFLVTLLLNPSSLLRRREPHLGRISKNSRAYISCFLHSQIELYELLLCTFILFSFNISAAVAKNGFCLSISCYFFRSFVGIAFLRGLCESKTGDLNKAFF